MSYWCERCGKMHARRSSCPAEFVQYSTCTNASDKPAWASDADVKAAMAAVESEAQELVNLRSENTRLQERVRGLERELNGAKLDWHNLKDLLNRARSEKSALEALVAQLHDLVDRAQPFGRHVDSCMKYGGWRSMSKLAEKWLDDAEKALALTPTSLQQKAGAAKDYMRTGCQGAADALEDALESLEKTK